jgi:hypothetical protein
MKPREPIKRSVNVKNAISFKKLGTKPGIEPGSFDAKAKNIKLNYPSNTFPPIPSY